MKYLRTLLTAIFLIAAVNVGYSLPTYFYGNIAIDGTGQLIPNSSHDIEVSIYNGGTLVYQEVHSGVNVDAFSAFVVEVGTGTPQGGFTLADFTALTANVNLKTQVRVYVGGTWISLGAKYTSTIINQSITGFSGDPSQIELPDANIIIGNTDDEGEARAVSGDATLSNTGVLTIANGAVTSAKILDGTILPADVDLTAEGWDFTTLAQGGNAVLTEATTFAGDVSGVYNNLQLNAGVVGADELASTTVTSGSYGNATTVPTFTVDADGRLTEAADVAIEFPAETDPQVDMTTANAVPVWDGTALVDGSMTDDGEFVSVGENIQFDVTTGNVYGASADFTGTLNVADKSTFGNTVTISEGGDGMIELGVASEGNAYADFVGADGSLNVVIGATGSGNYGAVSTRDADGDERAGMFYDGTSWIVGTGDLGTGSGAQLVYDPTNPANSPRIIAANDDGTTVFSVDIEGDVVANSFTQNGNAVLDVTSTFLGDVTGTIGATVVGDDSHSHTSATLPTDIVYDADLAAWTGSTNIATLGTITTGTWNGTSIADAYVDDNLTINTADNQFTLFDAADNTKVANFDLSGITAATTRTYTLPDADGTVALASDITLQKAYEGGDVVTNATGGDFVIDISNGEAFSIHGATTNDVFNIDQTSGIQMYNQSLGAGANKFLDISSKNSSFDGDVVNISSTGAAGSSTALNVLGNASTDNSAVYIDNAGEGRPLVVMNSSTDGTGQGVYIENYGSVNPALEIADNGGSVKLSYGTISVDSDEATIPPDVSVVYITSDNESGEDAITMPAGLNGEFLYVVYTSAGATANFVYDSSTIATTEGGNAKLTFVYANDTWHLISVVE